MTTRDFDAMLAEKANKNPTFTIGGQDFTLRSKLPYKRWNRLMATMRADDVDPDAATADFFRAVLVKGDRQRFIDLLEYDGEDDDDDEGVVDMSQMDALTDWVMEHFTGKLSTSSDSSSPGANGTGPAPNVVSLQSRSTSA